MGASENEQVVIIRFWREGAADLPDSRRWRARISDVNGDQQFSAEGVEETLAIVQSLLSRQDPQ